MDIDFVVLWVDGNDPAWRQEKAKYQGKTLDDSNSNNRFRDWGLMPYWFRAVEKFTPWVRKVHFVTCGHVPPFLNLQAPKLHHVSHSDYIPAEYLPTFSANTIEMNIHRIQGLSNHFVFFNDDTFILRPMPETSFFRDGLPCTVGSEVPATFLGQPGIWQHLIVNDLRTINNHFKKTEQVRQYRKKFRSRNYRWKDNIRTCILEKLYPEAFVGFQNLHAPAPFLKSTFETIWEKEPALLEETSSHRFRNNDDLNQWVALWWQVAAGTFSPFQTDNIVAGCTEQNVDWFCNLIRGQGHDMLCVNDPGGEISFELVCSKIRDAFDSILPQKSSFEK
ncbi:MAG: Stealth CR1 domain-containing protein [Oscillospiraceae bacterium]|nr:Stealth CR1 domain-containing protein [Oscillospiraceae bacterium]